MTRATEPLRIALVAHDQKKPEMVSWAQAHAETLRRHRLWGTGTTGALVAREAGLNVTLLKSGPLGGDQQLGAMIAEARWTFWCSSPIRSRPCRTTST